jgi:hypothetical protein
MSRSNARRTASEAIRATPVADRAFEPKFDKNHQVDQSVATRKNTKTRQNEKPRKLLWEAINPATWRLVDPDGPKIETPRCRHWPGFFTARAVAWVFDVGIGRSDWRVRVRKRGGWRAFGSIAELDVAKRIAQRAVQA